MRPFLENHVLQQQPFKPMIIVVDTTKAGSATNTFILPIIKDASETVKIYWGDGTNSVGATGDNTHVYASSGVYTVKILSKLFGGILFLNGGDKAKVKSILSFGDGVLRQISDAFSGCTALTYASNGYLKTISSATTSQSMFRTCSSLTTIPLFDLSKVASTISMFRDCAALTSIPLFDLSNVTDASYMFYGCTTLTTVPLFNLSKATSVVGLFYGCTGITTVPLFSLSTVTDSSYMFFNCSSLVSVPLFDLSKATNTGEMFFGCSSLVSVPLFDLSKATSTLEMFRGCTTLTTVPLFDLSKVANTGSMFRSCTNLTTIPLLNLSKVTSASNMFFGVTLTTTSYSNFLINLATLPLQSTVTFHGGNSKYNAAGGVARAYLISNFGWTITDGGAAP